MIQKHIRRVVIIVLLVVAAAAFAQEAEDGEIFVPTHTLGDQTLSINVGMFIPFFIAGGDQTTWGANLSLGAMGSLAWASYLTNELKVGIEAGGSFAFTPNRHSLFILPVVANASYVFQRYPFEFPVTLGLGMSVSQIELSGERYRKWDPFVKATGSFYWNYSTQFAFGANLDYWFIPQIYSAGSAAGAAESRLGTFLGVTLSALYHF
jgi:hypothetical protein